MNMNMNQKIVAIALGILIALVVIILVVIVVLENTNSKKTMNFANITKSENKTVIDEPEENKVENKIEDKSEKITGEITEVETEDGGIIPVPPTFEYVEGESSTGAVIADENGNEFVWVPVENINNYQRQMFIHNGESGETETSLEDENLRDINAYNEEFDDSIRNYGGFYIARYEAGKGTNNELVSKKVN